MPARSANLLFVALLALAAGCGTARRWVAAPGMQLDHGAPVRGDTCERRLALVFTGGEHGEGTAFILDALRAAGVPGSFFVTGDFLRAPPRAKLVRRMVAEGHYVGPHSHAHLLYCPWDERDRSLVSRATFRADLLRNIEELRRLGALPAGQPCFFIPPYEWYNADQVHWAAELDVVLFNFTPGSGSNRDWIPEGQRGFVRSAEILREILAYEERDAHGLNGYILLLHLGSQRQDKMHHQLPALLAALAGRGYACVRIDELLAP